jgi:hypothetical protein
MSSWWLNKQGAKKVILWDDTNINMPVARDEHLSQHTNSTSYAGNVAKGAVFLQLCSWMGTWELNYGLERFPRRNIKHEAASLMHRFVDHFDKGIPFTNIIDKGYRCIMATWRAGKQLFLQPVFAGSDRKFNTREVNRSSTMASERKQSL